MAAAVASEGFHMVILRTRASPVLLLNSREANGSSSLGSTNALNTPEWLRTGRGDYQYHASDNQRSAGSKPVVFRR